MPQASFFLITVIDEKGNIKYASPSCEKVLGYTPEQLMGQTIFELMHADDHCLLTNALAQSSTFYFSYRIQHKDGSWQYCESVGTNLLHNPHVEGIVLNSRDISDRKKEEDSRKQKEMVAIRFNLEKEQVEREKQITEKKNKELNEAYEVIEHHNKEISDSINYAFRIQTAILPNIEILEHHLPDSFVLWRPAHTVSGDFYWHNHMDGITLVSATDCTGHGVPGAFMTMIGNTILSQIVMQEHITMPDQILNSLHMSVRKALKQDQEGSTSRDGMDISFLAIDKKNKKVHWAGANNPLIKIRDGVIEEVKADKYPIGGLQLEARRTFTRHTFDLQTGDTYYLYTDGFQDQFGGDKGRKYMTKKFKEFLAKLSKEQSMKQQQEIGNNEIINWMGSKYEQIDDVLLVGVRV